MTHAAVLTNVTKFIEREEKTSFKLVTGHKPYLGLVRRFGTRCGFYNISSEEDKLGKRAIAGATLGLDGDELSNRNLELSTTRVHRIRDIKVSKPAPMFYEERKQAASNTYG